MILANVKDGDTFRIDGEKYRAMIWYRDGWGCRRWESESWSYEHHWFTLDRTIRDYEKFVPKSLASSGEDVDPMAR